jgi:hypothetical protein
MTGRRAPGADALDAVDRRLTAAVIGDCGPTWWRCRRCSTPGTLDHFHDTVLVPAGVAPYPHRVCLPGNDGRGLDVAVMSRRPLGTVASHAGMRPADFGLDAPEGFGDQPVFRRDCLLVEVGRLTLLVCHFKAPWPDAGASWPVRRLEAEAVRRILEARFADPARRSGSSRGISTIPIRRAGRDGRSRRSRRRSRWT